jgi:hypothetical protein
MYYNEPKKGGYVLMFRKGGMYFKGQENSGCILMVRIRVDI